MRAPSPKLVVQEPVDPGACVRVWRVCMRAPSPELVVQEPVDPGAQAAFLERPIERPLLPAGRDVVLQQMARHVLPERRHVKRRRVDVTVRRGEHEDRRVLQRVKAATDVLEVLREIWRDFARDFLLFF